MTNAPASKLAVVHQLLGLLAIVVYLGTVGVSTAQAAIERARSNPGLEGLLYSAHTSADAAKMTFTNRGAGAAWACVKGVVSSAATGTKIESHVVCTGDVLPHSSVTIEAPYRVGAGLEVCNKTGFGDVKLVDWSKCSFDVVDVSRLR